MDIFVNSSYVDVASHLDVSFLLMDRASQSVLRGHVHARFF